MATRWGICCAGKIAQDFVTAMKTLPASEHQVCAVAARTLESANVFAQRFSVPQAFGSYEELAKVPNLDVVYISTVHPYHHKLCMMFLNAGKNVLCEKPLAMNTKQAKEMIDLAKEKKLFLMEAIWSRFSPVYYKIREELASGSLGDVKLVTADMSLDLSQYERSYNRAVGGGAVLDVGLYPIQFASMVFNHEQPQKIIASGHKHPHSGADELVSLTLLYSGNRMAQLTFSFMCHGTVTSSICGTDGLATIGFPFFSPTKCTIKGQEYDFPFPDTSGDYNYLNCPGLAYEAKAVRESLLKGELENPLMKHSDTMMIASIQEEALKQLDVTYDDLEF